VVFGRESGWRRGEQLIPVPRVKGLLLSQAADILEASGLAVAIDHRLTPDFPSGHVVATSPREQVAVPLGMPITLVVAEGPTDWSSLPSIG
jgi:beta-lactam-binding protein with PASTA domain